MIRKLPFALFSVLATAISAETSNLTYFDEYTQLGRKIEIQIEGCEVTATSWHTKLEDSDVFWGSATFDLRGAELARHRDLILLATIASSSDDTFFKDGSDVLWDRNLGGSFNGSYKFKMRDDHDIRIEQNIKRQRAYDALSSGKGQFSARGDGQSFVVFTDNELVLSRKGDGGAEAITALETKFKELQKDDCAPE